MRNPIPHVGHVCPYPSSLSLKYFVAASAVSHCEHVSAFQGSWYITHSPAQEVEVDTKEISVARMGKSTYSITFSQSNTDLNQTKTTLLISTYLPWALRTVDDQHLSIPISDLTLQVQRCWAQVTRKDIQSDMQVTRKDTTYKKVVFTCSGLGSCPPLKVKSPPPSLSGVEIYYY